MSAGWQNCIHPALCVQLASSAKEVAAASDIVFTIVGYPADVEGVILGENGVLAGLKEGGIVVDMTTSTPSLAQTISEAAAKQGCGSVDAPVSGGDVGAKEARLAIMVGGEEGDVKRVMPLFELMGKNINHMGKAGAGQNTKMVNQILISSGMVALCEALLYAHKAGLDEGKVIAAVSTGAAGSWGLSNYGPRIVNRDFAPGFMVKHFLKDLGIALDEAKAMGLALPGLALANQLYLAVQAQGGADKGTQALMLALESMNGLQRGEQAARA
jgi:3-hydroxyisobutyrate dehydrogenase